MTDKEKSNEERWRTLAHLVYSISLDIEMMNKFREEYGDDMSDLEQRLFNQLETYVAQASSFANGIFVAMGGKIDDR